MVPPKGKSDGIYHCTTDGCLGTANLCPKCRVGALVRKTSRYGDIVACHIWPRCDYIEKTAQQGRRAGRRAGRLGEE
jgi:ssDNA-binding Zn-finger/Zn-ribbon topoisomerase 1